MLVDRLDREPLEAPFHYQSVNTRMEEYRKRHDECVLRQDIFLNDSNQRSHSENSRLYQVYMENVEKKNIPSFAGNQYPGSTLSNPNPSPSFMENGTRDPKIMVDSRTFVGTSAHNPSATGKMEWLETLSQYHNHLTTVPNHAYTPPTNNNTTNNVTYNQPNPSLGPATQDLAPPGTNFGGPGANVNYQPDYSNYSSRYRSYVENGLSAKVSPPLTTPSNGPCPAGFTPNGYYPTRLGPSEPSINGDPKQVLDAPNHNLDYHGNRAAGREVKGGSLSSLLHAKTTSAQGGNELPPVVAKRTYNTSASKLLAKNGLGLPASSSALQGQSSKEAKALAAKARKDQRRLLKAQKLLSSNTTTSITPLSASTTPNTSYKQRNNSSKTVSGSNVTSSCELPFTTPSLFSSPLLTDFNEPPLQGQPQQVQRKRRYNSNGAHSNRGYHHKQQDQGHTRSDLDCIAQQSVNIGCDISSMNAYEESIGSTIIPCDSMGSMDSNLTLIPPSIFGPGGGSNQGVEGGCGGMGNSSSQIQAFMDTYQISDDIMCNDAFQDILLGLEDLTDSAASLVPNTTPNNLISYFGSPPSIAQTIQLPPPSSPHHTDKEGSSSSIRRCETTPFGYNASTPAPNAPYKTEFCGDKWGATATPRWNNHQQQPPYNNGPYRNNNNANCSGNEFNQKALPNNCKPEPSGRFITNSLNNSSITGFNCNYTSTNNHMAPSNQNSMPLAPGTEAIAKIPLTLPKKVGRKKMAPKSAFFETTQPIGNGPDSSSINSNENLYGLKNIFNYNNTPQHPQQHYDSIFDYNASSGDYLKPNLNNTLPAPLEADAFKATSLCNSVKNHNGSIPNNSGVGGKRGKRSAKSIAPSSLSSSTAVASTLTSVVEKYGPTKGSRHKPEPGLTSRNKSTDSDPYNYTNDCDDYDIRALNPNYRRYSSNNSINPIIDHHPPPLPFLDHKVNSKTSPQTINPGHYPPNNGSHGITKYSSYPQYPQVQTDKQCGWNAPPRFDNNRAMQNIGTAAAPRSSNINLNAALDGVAINYDSNTSHFEPYRSQNHHYNNPYVRPGQAVVLVGSGGLNSSNKFFDNTNVPPMNKHIPGAAQLPYANVPCILDKRLDARDNSAIDQMTPLARIELDNALTEFLNSNDASIISGNGSNMDTAPNSYNSNTSQDQFNKASPSNISVKPIVDTFSQSPYTNSNQMTVEERNILCDFAAAADFFNA